MAFIELLEEVTVAVTDTASDASNFVFDVVKDGTGSIAETTVDVIVTGTAAIFQPAIDFFTVITDLLIYTILPIISGFLVFTVYMVTNAAIIFALFWLWRNYGKKFFRFLRSVRRLENNVFSFITNSGR